MIIDFVDEGDTCYILSSKPYSEHIVSFISSLLGFQTTLSIHQILFGAHCLASPLLYINSCSRRLPVQMYKLQSVWAHIYKAP